MSNKKTLEMVRDVQHLSLRDPSPSTLRPLLAALKPLSAGLCLLLATASWGLARADTDEMALKAVLESPTDAASYVDLASVEFNRGDLAACIGAATKALALGKLATRERAAAYEFRGAAYFRQGKYSTALDDLDQAIGLSPLAGGADLPLPTGGIYWIRALVLLALRQPERALENLYLARRLNPGCVAFALSQCEVWSMMDRRFLACHLSSHHASSAKDFRAPARAAADFASIKDFATARRYAQQALELQPKAMEAHLLLGVAYEGLLDYDRALREFDQALAIEPNSPAAQMSKAKLLASCSDAKIRNGAEAKRCALAACLKTENTDAAARVILAAVLPQPE